MFLIVILYYFVVIVMLVLYSTLYAYALIEKFIVSSLRQNEHCSSNS